ncbi:MAG TPA: hypothetical protein VH988_07380, partial [Thermoanaerobaculia bacterium]|nr:hypothetical protein [Thermoanaerobaculia bacterium]
RETRTGGSEARTGGTEARMEGVRRGLEGGRPGLEGGRPGLEGARRRRERTPRGGAILGYPDGVRTWEVAHTLLHPQGDNLWAVPGSIDLRGSGDD